MTILAYAIGCTNCNFSTADLNLMATHSCDVQFNGGRCEDYPCCGHEAGDCNGLLYGSSESIQAQVERNWAEGHGYCDHAEGLFNCIDEEDEVDEEDDFYYANYRRSY